MKKKPELLAPAGTLDALKTAILYGADAVYAGLPGFSMRARAKMSVEYTKAGIEFAHAQGKRVYLAFNLFAHDHEYPNLARVSEIIKYLSPDALIVSDPGIMMWVKENHPEMPIHISTQANICSAKTVKFWQAAGAKLCVLAREVSHSEFKTIREECPDIGLEIFVHGAMCMSYSGRCLLSNFITGRPANRGACAQLCRWQYDVVLRNKETGTEMGLTEDERGAYLMNSKDLCLMPRLNEVLDAQPDSLKIEGRNRSEYYVGSVVRAYRNAIDAWAAADDDAEFDPTPFMEDLDVLETRGYTTAFFDGKVQPDAHDYEKSRSGGEFQAAGVVAEVLGDDVVLELRNEIRAGDELHFIFPGYANPGSIFKEGSTNPSSSPILECQEASTRFPSCGGVSKARGGLSSQSSFKNYFRLPFNPNLVERAKELRKAGSLPEALLWKEIKGNKLNGLDFDRQKVIGNYIVDFFCVEVGVVIEIDDNSHDSKVDYDLKRNEFLKNLGLEVIHILAKDVLKNMDGVLRFLKDHPALRAPRNGRGTEAETPQTGGGLKCSVKLIKIIDAKDAKEKPKMSAGQKNSVLIPKSAFPKEVQASLTPLILAYKRK